MRTTALATAAVMATTATAQDRARDHGIPFDGNPGEHNAITDVEGVLVGHTTVIEGESIRTGVTAVMPSAELRRHFAGVFSLNGNGEMTGTHFIDEWGFLLSPVMVTGTHNIGAVHEGVIKWSLAKEGVRSVHLPVVAETWDGALHDMGSFPITDEHVAAALDSAEGGPVAEGNAGGGVGMMCHLFKGGIGTSSRVLGRRAGGWTVGALVQANYGGRDEMRIAGVPVGRHLRDDWPSIRENQMGDGSIIVVLATDAPMLPHQLRRVAKRASLGLARNGSIASTWSGDIFIAFSTAEIGDAERGVRNAEFVDEGMIDAIFEAAVQATEEAIINALVAAETMTGVGGSTVHAMPVDEVRRILNEHGRLEGAPEEEEEEEEEEGEEEDSPLSTAANRGGHGMLPT